MLRVGLGLRLGAREHLKTTALTIVGDPTPNYRGRGLTVEHMVKVPRAVWCGAMPTVIRTEDVLGVEPFRENANIVRE